MTASRIKPPKKKLKGHNSVEASPVRDPKIYESFILSFAIRATAAEASEAKLRQEEIQKGRQSEAINLDLD